MFKHWRVGGQDGLVSVNLIEVCTLLPSFSVAIDEAITIPSTSSPSKATLPVCFLHCNVYRTMLMNDQ